MKTLFRRAIALAGLCCCALVLLIASSDSELGRFQFRLPETIVVGDRTVEVDGTLNRNELEEEQFGVDASGQLTYEGEALRGIDLSSHQGAVRWEEVAASGVEFAMLRIGYRGYSAEGGLHEDSAFRANLAGAQENGLLVGVYFFSQAVTPEEAEEEAQFVLDTLAGRPLDYPVAFDWETIAPGKGARTNGMDGAALTQCALAFGEKIRAAGYQPAVYFYQDLGYMTYDLAQMQELVLWLAEDGSAPDFYYHFDWWQYTSSGQVAGIGEAVDLDLDLRGLERPARPGKSMKQAMNS